MKIGDLARAGGVGVETVRYYQRRGLLDEPPRAGGVRRYGDEHKLRLRFIRAAQAAGFTLEEVGTLLELDATDDRERARAMAAARILALDAKIADLKLARERLAKLALACGADTVGPCPIITAFETNC